jgi:hypothetical protein
MRSLFVIFSVGKLNLEGHFFADQTGPDQVIDINKKGNRQGENTYLSGFSLVSSKRDLLQRQNGTKNTNQCLTFWYGTRNKKSCSSVFKYRA